MMLAKKKDWNGCPVRYAAGIFGDKWCFVILRDVLLHGKRYYGEFLSSEEGIATNILAARLSHLEAENMLTRHTDRHKKSRVFYLPTPKSRALLPAFLSIMVWSTKFDPCTEAPLTFAPPFEGDPAATIAWYEAEIDRVNAALA